MPTPIAAAAKLIETEPELHRMVDTLNQETIVAVDTESNSLFAYREQVCLVQFSTGDDDYLLDPLALPDLSSLGDLFENPGIEKVFHAAEYDLLCLKRDFGFSFNNLFDTMLASRILGREAVGLGAMLEAEFGVVLDKRFQRADWGQRPLPPDLLAYARLDTHYLIQLRSLLKAELHATGRWELAQEDFCRMCAVESQNGRENGPGWWRISGSYDLSPQQAAVLAELWTYRDRAAQFLNRPAFKVLNDQTLLAIANRLPDSLSEISKLPGMTPAQVRRHGAKLLEAVQRGRQAPPVRPPRNPRPPEAYLKRLDRLRHWRKNAADQMGVSSDVVLPRDLLHDLAEQAPRDQAGLEAALHSTPWRLEHFGPQILTTLTRT